MSKRQNLYRFFGFGPLLGSVALVACTTTPPVIETDRNFSSLERDALTCVWLLSRSSTLLEQAGEIEEKELELLLTISASMLQAHVSGTEQDKLGGLIQARDSFDPTSLNGAVRDEVNACLKRFPVGI